MAGFTIIAAGAVLLVALLFFGIPKFNLWRQRRRKIRANSCKPGRRYPHADPVLGLDYFFANMKAHRESKLLKKYQEDFDRYGSTFVVNQFGSDVITTMDCTLLKFVMMTDFDNWGVETARYEAMRPAVGRTFFTRDGAEWKEKRAQTRPALAKTEYGDLSRLKKLVEQFIALLPQDGSTINLQGPITRLDEHSNLAKRYRQGESVNMLAPHVTPEQQNLMDSLETVVSGALNRLMMGRMVKYLPIEKKFHRASRDVRAFVEKNISRAMNHDHGETTDSQKSHRVFLDDMIGFTSNREDIRDAAFMLYLAGSDTTSGTLTSFFKVVSQHPEVVRKMRAEITNICEGPPDWEALQKLQYVKATIHEVMRLYGVTNTFNFRTALKDTILPRGGGMDGKSRLFVKKGTTMVMDYCALHRDRSSWGEDSHVFRPERFFEDRERDSFSFQPFGGVPRNCPGQNMARTNLLYIVTRVLQEFKGIESRDDRPWTEHLSIVTSSKYGAEVALIPA